jgi:hypothetical protein
VGGGRNARIGTYGCDIWIPQIVQAYWQPRISGFSYGELTDQHFQPFYDAAWELSRMGVLRPGPIMPRGEAMGGQLFSGDGFSITKFGREWLKDAKQRPVRDPSRLADVLQTFVSRFGGGYAQRATEAVRTYRTLELSCFLRNVWCCGGVDTACGRYRKGEKRGKGARAIQSQWRTRPRNGTHYVKSGGRTCLSIHDGFAGLTLLARRRRTRHHDDH